jgi:hypothetical protein
MFESTTTVGSSIQVVAPIGLFLLTLPVVAILVAVILFVKYPVRRKAIGIFLGVIGFLEIMPFIVNLIRDISSLIPFIFIEILLIYGFTSILCGVAMFFFAKPTKA